MRIALTRAQWQYWNFPYKSWWAATRQALPVSVKKLSCGNGHTLMLTGTGEVWAFGANDLGQVCVRARARVSVSACARVRASL